MAVVLLNSAKIKPQQHNFVFPSVTSPFILGPRLYLCYIRTLTLCILMDFPIYIDTISMELPIVCFKGTQVNFRNYDVFLSLKFVLILANSADSDEMQHFTAFHLSLHRLESTCLGFPEYKWLRDYQIILSGVYLSVRKYACAYNFVGCIAFNLIFGRKTQLILFS